VQKALIIRDYNWGKGRKTEGLDELNKFLNEGWKVINSTAMGSGQVSFHECLVVIEKM